MDINNQYETPKQKALDKNVVGPTYEIFTKKIPQFPGMKEREGQTNMALDVADSIKNSKNLMMEAGVGIGKSLAYLIPGLFLYNYYKAPIVIATSSIPLSEQLMGDIKQASRITKIFVKPVLGKGMNNYACLKRISENESLFNFLKRNPPKNINKYQKKLLNLTEDFWDKIRHYQDRTKFPDEIKDYIWEMNNVQECIYNKCPYYKECEYCKMRSELSYRGSSNVLVINQDLLISHLLNKEDNDHGFIKSYSLLIIDEAHNIENKMRNQLTKQWNEKEVKKLFEKIRRVLSRQSSVHFDDINDVEKFMTQLFSEFKYQIEKLINENKKMIDADRFPIFIPDSFDVQIFEKKMKDIGIALTYGKELRNPQEKEKLEVELNELKKAIALFKTQNNSSHLFWGTYNISKKLVEFCSAPKDINKILERLLFSKSTIPIILTSATLCQNGKSLEDKYSYIKNSLGFIGDYSEPQLSPFPYSKNTGLYIPSDIIEYNINPELFLEQAAKKIKELVYITDGRTLVLFTAKEDMEKIYQKLLSEKLPWPVLKQVSGLSLDKVRDTFKKSKGILLATGYWEGFNVPGPDLSSLIIVRLPFPVPDPIITYKTSKAKDKIMDVLVPEMIIKLRQGAGRLIRCETDTGILSILDPRISNSSTRPYKEITLQSLPFKTILSSLDEVKAFTDKKIPKIKQRENLA